MFDERVPSELRVLLMGAFAAHRRLATALAWVGALSAAPTQFDLVVRAEVARIAASAWVLVERYRRGELTVTEVEVRLEADFAWDRQPSPELEAFLARAALPAEAKPHVPSPASTALGAAGMPARRRHADTPPLLLLQGGTGRPATRQAATRRQIVGVAGKSVGSRVIVALGSKPFPLRSHRKWWYQ